MADYSRPAAALSELNAAKVQLTAATPDKGGHRDNAITYMNYAIAEIEAEIQAQGQ